MDHHPIIVLDRGIPGHEPYYEVYLWKEDNTPNNDELIKLPVAHPVVTMSKEEIATAIRQSLIEQDKEDISITYDLQPPIYDPFGLMTGLLLIKRREALREGHPISSAERLLELAQALEQLSKKMAQTSPKRKHKIKRLAKMISAGKAKFAATLEDSFGFGSIDELIAKRCDSCCKVSSCVAKSNLHVAEAIMRKIPP